MKVHVRYYDYYIVSAMGLIPEGVFKELDHYSRYKDHEHGEFYILSDEKIRPRTITIVDPKTINKDDIELIKSSQYNLKI